MRRMTLPSFRADRLVKASLRERFVLTLKTGETFEGLLVDADQKTVRLVDAFALEGNNRIGVDGDLFVPRIEISYLQRPGGRV
jgi:small nuclear ribonucleoprotein (snRNP)-like protein